MAHSLLRHFRCLPGLTTRRSLGSGSLALVAALSAGAGCYIDPINRAPYIASIDTVGTVQRNREAKLKITAYDPDSDRLTVTWGVTMGTCPDDKMDSTFWPVARKTGEDVTVEKSMTSGRFCVWAFATDPYGAMSLDDRIVDPANQPPQAIIDVISPSAAEPFDLYSQVVLTSDNSMDPDSDLTFSWALMGKPTDSMAFLTSAGCALPKSSTARDVWCFTADKPGQYDVALTATEASSDGNTPNQTTTVPRVFNVKPDRLPCILSTMPMYGDHTIPVLGDPGGSMKFQVVTVDDDGDPYPTMTPNDLSFTWALTGPDGHLQALENDIPSLTLGLGNYHIG
ncbi:MAG TPA: hypothetical protein VIU64_05270, partial [Polyangia bacterium]